jgi:hypothetical protein
MTGQTEVMKNALKVLGELIKANAMAGKSISARQILEATGLTEDEYWPADEFLIQQGYIDGTLGGLNAPRRLRGEGIEFYERKMNPSPSVQVGAIFQGPVEDSQIQAFATAVDSRVQQVIQNTSPNAIRDEICKIVEDMVKAVRAELNQNELTSYVKLAKEFQEEVKKDTPSKSLLHRLLVSLSFFGDLEGAIELGDRALKLAQHVLPYLPIIIGYLNQI